jgi:hypothetical protein
MDRRSRTSISRMSRVGDRRPLSQACAICRRTSRGRVRLAGASNGHFGDGPTRTDLAPLGKASPRGALIQIKIQQMGVHVGCAGGVRVACAGGVRGFGCRCAGVGVHCRCAFFRRCFGCGCGGCGGCGGWGCGTCWIWTPTWGWINTCWSESTPAGEEARVASEQIAQTAMAEKK